MSDTNPEVLSKEELLFLIQELKNKVDENRGNQKLS